MCDKKNYIIALAVGVIIIGFLTFVFTSSGTHNLSGVVSDVKEGYFVVKKDTQKYKFAYSDDDEEIVKDSTIEIKYRGKLKKNSINKMQSYTLIKETVSIVDQLDKDGIFSSYYEMAKEKLDTMTLDEKIGQLLLVRVPEGDAAAAVKKYNFGGYVLFERDFKDKNKDEINKEIKSYQDASKIPMIIATDEEGGNVVRASSNKNLRDKPFLSSQELYKSGGLESIEKDTIDKSKFLNGLGVNVNLAPVVDVVTDSDAYMYKRSLGEDTKKTSEYAETVIKASKGEDVSYVLKHFPGYGNNADTHVGSSVDSRTKEEIMEADIPPFRAGIKAMAEAVLVSHNIIPDIEKDVPASLSKNVNDILRKDLDFSGIVITDDLDMVATKKEDAVDIYLKAVKAGNDMLIVTDYDAAYDEIKAAVEDNTLDPETVDKAVLRILAWKYYKILFPTK